MGLSPQREDGRLAAAFLADLHHVQLHGPNADGLGVIAASKDKLSDCGGDFCYASLHTGTTARYRLAALKADPFTLSNLPVHGPPGGS